MLCARNCVQGYSRIYVLKSFTGELGVADRIAAAIIMLPRLSLGA